MGSRSIEFAFGEYYHVYNRGVDKRTIYLDASDYRRFRELLYITNTTKPSDIRSIGRLHENICDWERGDSLVAIGAYCLMPNHFHILLTPLVEQGVSLFMNKLGTSYSMYFNRKYKRTGALFEGKFKAQHANDDVYLKYLFSYIHLNPVKLIQADWKERGIVDAEAAYKYACAYHNSSLSDVIGTNRPENAILELASFPDYFPSAAHNKIELLEWLNYKPIESQTS